MCRKQRFYQVYYVFVSSKVGSAESELDEGRACQRNIVFITTKDSEYRICKAHSKIDGAPVTVCQTMRAVCLLQRFTNMMADYVSLTLLLWS